MADLQWLRPSDYTCLEIIKTLVRSSSSESDMVSTVITRDIIMKHTGRSKVRLAVFSWYADMLDLESDFNTKVVRGTMARESYQIEVIYHKRPPEETAVRTIVPVFNNILKDHHALLMSEISKLSSRLKQIQNTHPEVVDMTTRRYIKTLTETTINYQAPTITEEDALRLMLTTS